MNDDFLRGYYQGAVETAPASLAMTMVVQHLRHTNLPEERITDLVNHLLFATAGDPTTAARLLELTKAELESLAARLMAKGLAK
ncbi:hypothetical protein HZI63_06140 [Limosilactobacillus fermentum]|uniref:hypothetical protein n=1 Tax=Limosilactobacillus fermentum TaxID=1613 RepID=UPI001FCC3B7B|nr:hypothetical protein [Limosilactobacillus fermentum]MCJ2388478.1 hypothetical protein [Limosilactobacillus fermentum]